MAISSKIEEIILELTKNVGNIYDSLLYGIGDETTPGSSIFEINNLVSKSIKTEDASFFNEDQSVE